MLIKRKKKGEACNGRANDPLLSIFTFRPHNAPISTSPAQVCPLCLQARAALLQAEHARVKRDSRRDDRRACLGGASARSI
jgi:hypothetical protein